MGHVREYDRWWQQTVRHGRVEGMFPEGLYCSTYNIIVQCFAGWLAACRVETQLSYYSVLYKLQLSLSSELPTILQSTVHTGCQKVYISNSYCSITTILVTCINCSKSFSLNQPGLCCTSQCMPNFCKSWSVFPLVLEVGLSPCQSHSLQAASFPCCSSFLLPVPKIEHWISPLCPSNPIAYIDAPFLTSSLPPPSSLFQRIEHFPGSSKLVASWRPVVASCTWPSHSYLSLFLCWPG